MVVVDTQIVRLPADGRVAVPAGKTIEVWDGAANLATATAPTEPPPPPPAAVGVSVGAVKVRRKRAQVTFTVVNGPADGTIQITRVKKRSSKVVTTQAFTQAAGEQTVTVAKRLKPGRYTAEVDAAGQVAQAPFRVR